MQMKAVVCKLTPLRYLMMKYASRISPSFVYGGLCMAKLVEIPEPELIDEEWVKIKVALSGICGSDIGTLNGKESFYLEPYISKSFVLGHENVGVISKLGNNVKDLKLGDRVVVVSFLACRQRGIELCRYCKEGNYALCENINEGRLSRGLGIGWNDKTSGGWSEYFIAHSSNVFKLPDKVSDESAVMIDSFSCALHAVMQNPPKENDVVLVYGCGTMGINAILSLRALGFKNKIIVIYSREFQKGIALKLGANALISQKEDLHNKIKELTNAKLYYPKIGKPVIEGGVDIVYDCVGKSDTLNNSLRFLRAQGKVVMIATAGGLNIDIAPVWFRELIIKGSCQQSSEKYKNSIKPAYEIVIEMLAEGKIELGQFVTHKFPLHKFKEGLKTAINKNSKNPAIKVALQI